MGTETEPSQASCARRTLWCSKTHTSLRFLRTRLTTPHESYSRTQLAGLFVGPLIVLGMLLLPVPRGLSVDGWSVAAVALLMGIWWMTEAVPLAATALLPLVLFPLLGLASLDETGPSYANPLIFLFLGGFMMARAMVGQNLSQRIALNLLRSGTLSLSGAIGSSMVATAFLSMWVCNTATTMMMLPIGQSIIGAVQARANDAEKAAVAQFSTAMMLGIAYSATIGGMGTLIGTPPNALFAAFMLETYGVEVEFWRWMMIGVPTVLILLPIAWFLLTKVSFSFEVDRDLLHSSFIETESKKLGSMSRGEWMVALVISGAAFLWVFRNVVDGFLPGIQLSDAGIALTAAMLLFVLPGSKATGERLLTWNDAVLIRWDILLLFGGGLALAGAINSSGLAVWIGNAATVLSALPTYLFLVGIFVVIVLLGELASNTAVAAIFLPVAGASAIALGMEAEVLVMSVALAATVGFMLPVATPPNAIVFGSGALKIPDMIRAGALLDIVAILVVAALAMALGPFLFGAG